MSRAWLKPWTPAEEAYISDNYGKIPLTKIGTHLGRDPDSISYKLRQMGIRKCVEYCKSVPMQEALTADQCDTMRDFLRALTHYGKHGKDVGSFMKEWREIGYVYKEAVN